MVTIKYVLTSSNIGILAIYHFARLVKVSSKHRGEHKLRGKYTNNF